MRTWRSRTNPQRANRPSQPGQHKRAAARSASITSGSTIIANTLNAHSRRHARQARRQAHRRTGAARVGELPDPATAGETTPTWRSGGRPRTPRSTGNRDSQIANEWPCDHHHAVADRHQPPITSSRCVSFEGPPLTIESVAQHSQTIPVLFVESTPPSPWVELAGLLNVRLLREDDFDHTLDGLLQ